MEARLESLQRQHKAIHTRIEALEAEKAPDKYIKPLKQRKLLLKDEIQRISNELDI